jgi:hypothetical protein
LLGK